MMLYDLQNTFSRQAVELLKIAEMLFPVHLVTLSCYSV